MNRLMLLGAVLAASLSSPTHALTIDLTDSHVVLTPNPSAPTVTTPIVTQETAGGATFVLTNILAGGANGLTFGPSGDPGLNIGGASLTTTIFSIATDTDVTFTAFTGDEFHALLSSPDIEVSIGGSVVSASNVLPASLSTTGFNGGGFGLAAGQTATFTVTNASNLTHGTVTGFEFDLGSSPAPVPLPASLPLLMAGIGAIGLLRRKLG
ncbi:MAG: VPLPA-CTERM sorting domain-containing protein [Pseudomonadota bacterium]